MNTGTMQNVQKATFLPDVLKASPSQLVHSGRSADEPEERPVAINRQNHRLFHFIAELRRRRVCRAITMYSVAMWLVCQIVDVVSPELGLPDWTLKFVILVGLLGLPIALILSWLFEITPDGLLMEGAGSSNYSGAREGKSRRPLDQIIDGSLVLAALIISVQLAAGVLSTDSNAAQSDQQRIAVVPFRVASGNDAETLSEGLAIELQHELARQTHITVIAGRDPYLTAGSQCLTGAVAVGEYAIRITATMIDTDTGTVTWSKVFEQPRTNSLMAPVGFAKEIVAALPGHFQIASAAEADHAI